MISGVLLSLIVRYDFLRGYFDEKDIKSDLSAIIFLNRSFQFFHEIIIDLNLKMNMWTLTIMIYIFQ